MNAIDDRFSPGRFRISAVGDTLRAVVRIGRVSLHLGWALVLVSVAWPLTDPAARHRMKQRWSRQLLLILGLRLRVSGGVPLPGELVVANHVSWLDIFAINAVQPCIFISKDDVRGWPLIGWLSGRVDTLFLARGSARAAQAMRIELRDALVRGLTVAVFPEGTTSDGRGVLPFHGALLQGALDITAPVRPLALRYVDEHGGTAIAPAYHGDARLIATLWRIALAQSLVADLRVLPRLPVMGGSRRDVAAAARGMIVGALGSPVAGEDVPDLTRGMNSRQACLGGSVPCVRRGVRRSLCNCRSSRRS